MYKIKIFKNRVNTGKGPKEGSTGTLRGPEEAKLPGGKMTTCTAVESVHDTLAINP